MSNKINNLAIIPARSGSKGLKDKNIKLINGKPLLYYSIQAAKESKIFDEIMVSTDSQLYADIAKECGASIPFLRSNELSTDTASTWDVVRKIIDSYANKDIKFDMVTLLQPTTPLRTHGDIISAYKIFNEKSANAVVSVCEVDHSPLWCNTLPDDYNLTNFLNKDNLSMQRQQISQYYRLNGAIYMFKTDYFSKCSSIYDENCFACVMDKSHSIDIDDEFDFKLAQAIMNIGY